MMGPNTADFEEFSRLAGLEVAVTLLLGAVAI